MEAELERVRKSFRAELVPIKHTGALIPARNLKKTLDSRRDSR